MMPQLLSLYSVVQETGCGLKRGSSVSHMLTCVRLGGDTGSEHIIGILTPQSKKGDYNTDEANDAATFPPV